MFSQDLFSYLNGTGPLKKLDVTGYGNIDTIVKESDLGLRQTKTIEDILLSLEYGGFGKKTEDVEQE